MIPLNKINDPDKVLLQKVDVVNTIEEHVHNTIIDQYNQVMIDGDVEKLAFEIYFSSILNRDLDMAKRLWNDDMIERDKYRLQAERLIANLDKFLVLKKG